ncbi:endonuclease VII domain-containing protein [Streptomyces sp. NPDC020794]|uniref:endonuclease VII domain-containing protein n=1 Tax=unclassified Streptomyces TaxID=2593676 RepID=UPI0036ECCB0E
MSETSLLKACSACRETKPISDFYMQSTNPDSRVYGRPQGRCKRCVGKQTGAYQRANQQRTAERRRSWWLKTQFDITVEDYDRMLAEQGGVCAICSGPPEGSRWKQFHVDHCHTTGRVRGLLCGRCNRGMGYLCDDSEIALRAAQYLSGEDEA